MENYKNYLCSSFEEFMYLMLIASRMGCKWAGEEKPTERMLWFKDEAIITISMDGTIYNGADDVHDYVTFPYREFRGYQTAKKYGDKYPNLVLLKINEKLIALGDINNILEFKFLTSIREKS